MTTTVTDAAPEKVAPLARSKKARPDKFALIETCRVHHRLRADPGVTQDDVRHMDFWALVAMKLHRHDLITILADDESWELECCVERVIRDGAEVSVRKVYKRMGVAHSGSAVDDAGEFVSEWRAGEQWCVIRRKDGYAIDRGHANESSAKAAWHARQPRKAA